MWIELVFVLALEGIERRVLVEVLFASARLRCKEVAIATAATKIGVVGAFIYHKKK